MQAFRVSVVLVAAILATVAAGCTREPKPESGAAALNVVATTNLVGDLVEQIGGMRVNTVSLMGPGVDPHLYKAKAGDVGRLTSADVIFYGGLHLEGKMVELFEEMAHRGQKTIAVTDGCDKSLYIESESFGGNYDPHVWFDVNLWACAAEYVAAELVAADPEGTAIYRTNLETVLEDFNELKTHIHQQVSRLPEERRVLVTSHDAFGYFGRAYGFEVFGLQGLSTELEAGTADVQRLANLVFERKLPALFIESSVSPRGIEAVRAAVRAKGFDVQIGGDLFSDALGEKNTPEGTYVGMVRHNVNTIVSALAANPQR